MGNVLKRSNYRDLELQRSTSLADQYNVQKCDCVNVVPDPDHGKCLHSAIKERNFEYASIMANSNSIAIII